MSARYYRLTVKTSCKSVTAFRLEAASDKEAIVKALKVVAKFDFFCEEPTFEVVRGDGTRVHDVSTSRDPMSTPRHQDLVVRIA